MGPFGQRVIVDQCPHCESDTVVDDRQTTQRCDICSERFER